ncbi:MAG: FecR domain-containing protein [Bacteriovorax sp.]
MKKIFCAFTTMFIMCSLHLALFPSFALDKDWILDPKTSTLIPKYLGKVKVVDGKASIGDRELKKGSKIYNNELVQTSEKSHLVIEMIDLTLITLGPLSDFKVDNWSYRTKNDRDAEFSVIKGQWRAFIRSKAKDEDQLKIKTNLVSMGIRGTELMVNVNKIEDKEVTQVALLSGHIHLEGDLPKNMKRDMKNGDYAVIGKSSKGLELHERIMSPLEMKSYKEFVAPEVPRLLEPLTGNFALKEKVPPEHAQIDDDQVSKTKINNKAAPPKSLEENLEILNTTREENLKSDEIKK